MISKYTVFDLKGEWKQYEMGIGFEYPPGVHAFSHSECRWYVKTASTSAPWCSIPAMNVPKEYQTWVLILS